MKIFLIVLLFFVGDSLTIKLCARTKQIVNNQNFFQRVETENIEKCLERCLENIDVCRSLAFVKNSNKKNEFGICQLYTVNSESNPNSFVPESDPTTLTTVYEISESCSQNSFQTDSTALRAFTNEYVTPPIVISQSTDRRVVTERKGISGDTGLPKPSALPTSNKAIVPVRVSHAQTGLFGLPVAACSGIFCPPKQGEPISSTQDPLKAFGKDVEKFFASLTTTTPLQTKPLIQGTLITSASSDPEPQKKDDGPCLAINAGDPCTPKRKDLTLTSKVHTNILKETGIWGPWSSATACSIQPPKCGKGVIKFIRTCLANNICTGINEKEEECGSACESWASWSDWSGCSKDCGNSQETRKRNCLLEDKSCVGPENEVRVCEGTECGSWLSWVDSACSVTCGVGGTVKRERKCSGVKCKGNDFETRECEGVPKECSYFNLWSEWTTCSASCSGGEKTRFRKCINGNDCKGHVDETIACNIHMCPEWTQWTSSACSTTCALGVKIRSRECKYLGVTSTRCQGSAQDQTVCSNEPCPFFGEWTHFSDCSSSCGQGQTIRTRDCQPKGSKCNGPDSEVRFCHKSVCPYFTEWSEFGGCDVQCGIGSCQRTRKCIKAADNEGNEISEERLTHEERDEVEKSLENKNMSIVTKSVHKDSALTGDDLNPVVIEVNQSNYRRSPVRILSGNETSVQCAGKSVERKACDAGPCCLLSPWEDWNSCSNTCGKGTKSRKRSCSVDVNYKGLFINRKKQDNRFEVVGKGVASVEGLTPIRPINDVRLIRGKRQTVDWTNYKCECEGSLMEDEDCLVKECEEEFSSDKASIIKTIEVTNPKCNWNEWTECSGDCSKGARARTRNCGDLTITRHGIKTHETCDCDGKEIEAEACIPKSCRQSSGDNNSSGRNLNEQPVSVDYEQEVKKVTIIAAKARNCGWDEWNSWSRCIGEGIQTRQRNCPDACQCTGVEKEDKSCQMERYNGSNTGEQMKNNVARSISEVVPANETNVDYTVKESDNVDVIIYARDSKTRCSYESWSLWSECSTKCGIGSKIRIRLCPCSYCGRGKTHESEGCITTGPCESPFL